MRERVAWVLHVEHGQERNEVLDRLGYRCRAGLGVPSVSGTTHCGRSFCTIANWLRSKPSAKLLVFLNSSARPADVLLPKQIFIEGYSASMPTCLDFAVTHTQQPLSLDCASVTTGAAAGRYEESVKAPRHMEECKENGLNIIPMVVEEFGAWGLKSAPVFSFVSRAVETWTRNDRIRICGKLCL